MVPDLQNQNFTLHCTTVQLSLEDGEDGVDFEFDGNLVFAQASALRGERGGEDV